MKHIAQRANARLKRNSRRVGGIVVGIVVAAGRHRRLRRLDLQRHRHRHRHRPLRAGAHRHRHARRPACSRPASVNVPFTVTNPNPYAVTLSKIALTGVTVNKAGCTASVVSGADLPDTDVIAAGGTTASRNFSVTMSNAAEDACQGAVFTLTLQANGAQQLTLNRPLTDTLSKESS